MIVTSIGIIALIIIILLIGKILNKKEDKEKQKDGIVITLLVWVGLPVVLTIIIFGILQPTKMGNWKVKEAIEPTLLSDDEDNTFGGYTYQYLIPNWGSTKPYVINYTVNNFIEEHPILIECERKAEPTIWTLGLGSKETKYVFYNSDGTVNELQFN